jgi:hypothetical protein
MIQNLESTLSGTPPIFPIFSLGHVSETLVDDLLCRQKFDDGVFDELADFGERWRFANDA